MRRWLAVSWSVLRRVGSTIANSWRRRLQFRVVASTLLLGLLVVVLLGAYLYRAIGSSLENDRIRASQSEAQSLTTTAQANFDSAVATDVNSLYSVAQTLVQGQLVPPGADQTRYVILTRAIDNTSTAVLGTMGSPGVSSDVVTDSIRRAVSADPTRQQTQIVQFHDPQTDSDVPAVVVGSQVQVPIVGAYDLFFIFPMRAETATLQHISRSFSVGGLILVLLVGAIAWVVARQVVVPVRRASAVAERLAAGNLNERMPARGHDELALLAKSFNAMADSLQTQIHQLEGLSRVQQRFVSDVSHELRTPLTTIRMAADLIFDAREQFGAGVARSAELLHTELDRFEDLLADLLEISRFDAGAAALDTDPTDLAVLARKVVDGAASLAEVRGSKVTVTVEKSDRSTIAEVDPRRVERILRNLVVNAIEHGEGRRVTVTLAGNDDAVAVVVADRGVGLRPGEASLVFNRFWRADPARTRTTGGTGLGLAISLEDARLHDGWLQAWGEPGVGARFRLTVPKRVGEPIGVSPFRSVRRVPSEWRRDGAGSRPASSARCPVRRSRAGWPRDDAPSRPRRCRGRRRRGRRGLQRARDVVPGPAGARRQRCEHRAPAVRAARPAARRGARGHHPGLPAGRHGE
ncbi:MtrAB system histidine kinase MtrB [Nostocoides japonicum]|uniref:MtrAB system histidine kinase MtrB n=1 Tax=Nostocoides japonicum TaxID=99481 RepID=UPI001EED9058|nr:MtrAB system histidine kinase MtrB [Tetrasphaera japonica]